MAPDTVPDRPEQRIRDAAHEDDEPGEGLLRPGGELGRRQLRHDRAVGHQPHRVGGDDPLLHLASLALPGFRWAILTHPAGLWDGMYTGLAYWLGVAAVGVLLGYEHAIVRPGDLRRLDAAFFTVNGVISVVFLAFVAAETLA
mgnify:CR=1 FL=1